MSKSLEDNQIIHCGGVCVLIMSMVSPDRSSNTKTSILPEVHLGQSLQEFSANKPVGGVPQSQQVYHQLEAQLTQGTTAHSHDAVLEHTKTQVRFTNIQY